MAKMSIEFDIEVPDEITYDDLLEWVRFELHDNGCMAGSNPMVDKELTPIFGTLQVETAI